MRLLFDQNLSHKLVAHLAAEFPGSSHVRDVGLAAAADPDGWAYAAANGFALVSKDTDFQQRALLYGHPPKVIWVRTGNGPTSAVTALFRSRFGDTAAFEADRRHRSSPYREWGIGSGYGPIRHPVERSSAS